MSEKLSKHEKAMCDKLKTDLENLKQKHCLDNHLIDMLIVNIVSCEHGNLSIGELANQTRIIYSHLNIKVNKKMQEVE